VLLLLLANFHLEKPIYKLFNPALCHERRSQLEKYQAAVNEVALFFRIAERTETISETHIILTNLQFN
jgi:hypothetical protein